MGLDTIFISVKKEKGRKEAKLKSVLFLECLSGKWGKSFNLFSQICPSVISYPKHNVISFSVTQYKHMDT